MDTDSTDDTYFVVRFSPAQLKCDACGAPLYDSPRGSSGPYILVGHPDVRDEVRGRACSNECVPVILAKPIEYATNRRTAQQRQWAANPPIG